MQSLAISVPKSIDFFGNIERAFSKTRFDGYKMQGGTERDALAKYLWNTMLCESLCPNFQILEVAFRNSVHAEIAKVLGDGKWLSNNPTFLYQDELDAIEKSKNSVQLRRALTEDTLIAEMKFGFWTSLLDARYDTLWHKVIAGVFPHMPKTVRTRREVSKPMNAVRHLRNSALHHHSIWHWKDLKDQHAQMRSLISYICKSSDAIAAHLDRFPSIHAAGLEECKRTVAKMLA